jgi:hypothetical protein
LEVNNCERLTDYVLSSIDKYNPILEVLAMNVTPNISEPAIEEFRKSNP